MLVFCDDLKTMLKCHDEVISLPIMENTKGMGLALRGDDETTMHAVNNVISELASARQKFPAFNSGHEGYAVILEEMEELKEEVFRKDQSQETMRVEAMQVAAMGIRFMIDVCGKE